MKLDAAQETALDMIGRWLGNSDQQAFVLAGYAGTGKTTIMKYFAESLDRPVRFCTPTAKAGFVLKGKLPPEFEVSTIHSFLYKPIEVTEWDFEYAKRQRDEAKKRFDAAPAGREKALLYDELRIAELNLAQVEELLDKGGCEFTHKDDPTAAEIMVVDETSMVDERIEMDLRRQCAKILFVGDSGQLPPVNGRDFFERNHPDFTLEEVYRNAGPILRLTMAIRRDEDFNDWDQDTCRLVQGRPDFSEIEDAQIITGKNDTRRRLNRAFRRRYDHHGVPRKGEPLMCLRNDHGKSFINGVAGVAVDDAKLDSFGDLRIDLSYGGRVHEKLALDPFNFRIYDEPKISRRNHPARDAQFDYGYSLTCHKAQGSEFPHVAVWDDKMRAQDAEMRRRWKYTAASRAAGKLTWVNP